jgi:DNA-directed RNA polymerase specialized sigma24 family protein
MSNLYGFAHFWTRRLGVSPGDDRFDDLAQEGVISAWQAAQRGKDETYQKVCVKNRITGMLMNPSKRAPFGHIGTKTYEMTHKIDRSMVLSSQDLTMIPDENEGLSLETRDILDGLNPRYRYIAYAVAAGSTWAEIGGDLGEYSWEIERMWGSEIAPILRELV